MKLGKCGGLVGSMDSEARLGVEIPAPSRVSDVV